MISDRDLVAVERPGSPYSYGTMPRAEAVAAIAARGGGEFRLVRVPSCRVCGAPAWSNLRCTKHQGRNPCVVEGCQRTAKAPPDGTLSCDDVICSTHWRTYVPPRSPERLAYLRLWRLRRKSGEWTPFLLRRFWRVWAAIVRRVRARSTEGALDEAEIRRMFGWDED